jgi:hypothetical protein
VHALVELSQGVYIDISPIEQSVGFKLFAGPAGARVPSNAGASEDPCSPALAEIIGALARASTDRHLVARRPAHPGSTCAAEHDLDHRRGSILVRNGKGGHRGEVGMDEWGWEQLRPWMTAGRPAGRTAVLHHRRPDPRATVVGRPPSAPSPSARRPRRDQAPLCAAPAASRPRARARPRGRAAEHPPAPARPRQPRHTSIYLQGNDPEEIIATVRPRRGPMMSASAGLRL